MDKAREIYVFLLYAPIVLISYWKLIPRLSPTAKRIACGFLAAQVLVIAVSLETRSASIYEWWLWHLGKEWNIPSVLASTQMALVGFAALATAWLAQARPAWQRFYLVGIGLVFLHIGLDEFFAWKDVTSDWEERYMLVGAAVAVTTVTVALCSPRRIWIWHLCLLTGLSLVATGAFKVDLHRQFYFLEESLELLGIWLALIAMLGLFSDAAPIPKPCVRRFLYALPALWIFLLSQSVSILPSVISSQQVVYSRAKAVAFESDIHLRGLKRVSAKDLDNLYLRLYLSPRRWDFNGLGYSIHLIDQASGELVVSTDEWADRRYGFWFSGPDYAPIYQQAMELGIPPRASVNRAFWVTLTAWREKDGEYVHQRIIDSNLPLLDDTQVVLGELVLPAASAATPFVPPAIFNTATATLTTPFTWRFAPPLPNPPVVQ